MRYALFRYDLGVCYLKYLRFTSAINVNSLRVDEPNSRKPGFYLRIFELGVGTQKVFLGYG